MTFISSIKKYSIGVIIVSLLLGILFTAFPVQCKDAISLVIGISIILLGVIGIIKFFIKDRQISSIIMGIITIIFGVIICLNILPILNVIVGIIGVLLILCGLFDFIIAIRIIIASGLFGWITLVLSLASMVLGGFAVANTNETTVAIFRFVGIALIVYAILDTISFIQVKKFVKDVKTAVDVATEGSDTIETTAEYIDE